MKTIEDKSAQKLGNKIQKIVGDKTKFILITFNEDEGTLANLSNMSNKIEAVGMLELTKADYTNKKQDQ